MQFLRITMLLAALGLAACQPGRPPVDAVGPADLPQGIRLVETVQKSDASGIVIPYRKFELDNGLTVVLHEDMSDPLVHVDVTYHVGSGREEVGKSGFAHFFEHMMFEGSEHVANGQHAQIIEEAGGTFNGSTNFDITNYYETVPSNQLEKMLWLEADRMGFLLDAVTQEKFEIQRDTVKNERGFRMDNQPYGLLYERVNEALYPEGHPYSWQPIGYIEDLNRVDVNDLKKFFLRWYGPNNAVITIGGKFDEAEVLAWLKKYFGPIPRGPEVSDPVVSAVSLESDRYISLEDKVALPLLYMAFPTVNLYHEDEAPLDVLMYILGQGETSLLYKNMMKNGQAVQAMANHGCQELSCTFTIVALPSPASGNSLSDLEKIARASLAEFAERGVEPDDLTRVKMNIVSGMIYGLESVAGKVGRLASYETFTGSPNFAAADIARYENVSEEDVMRVYEKYIVGKPAVIMSIVPQGQAALVAAEDTWKRYDRSLPDYAAQADDKIEFRRAVDDFDRSIAPPSGDNPSVIVPEIWRAKLDNGIEILGAVNSETPTAAIQLRIEAGQRRESLDKLGLAAMTAAMLNEATTERSNEELSNELQKLGSSVRFGGGNEDVVLTIRSLSESLDATLAIAAEQLLQPKFDPEDFARLKEQTIQGIRQGKTQPATIAAVAYQMLLFGENNSFAYMNAGTEETVSKLTLDDVKEFYAANYSPKISSIVAVSDQPKASLVEKLKVFARWEGGDVENVALAPFPDTATGRIYLVDNPGAVQSEIRIGKRSLKYDPDGDYYRATLMNFPLGAAASSRLYRNLRQDKGYTYGAFSGFSGGKDYGMFTSQAAVRSDATAASIIEFENELRSYAESGITEPELALTRRAVGQSDARKFETPAQKIGFLSQILTYNLDDDFVSVQNRILEEIGREELNKLAAEHLKVDDMIIVVVGDKESVLPQLEDLGYDIVELDIDGRPVTSGHAG
jgi:zinc protease